MLHRKICITSMFLGKAKLISRGEYASAEALQTVMNMGMMDGITQNWDRLEERLKGLT